MSISFNYLPLRSHSPSLPPSTLYFSNSKSMSLRFAPRHFPNSLHFQLLDHKIQTPFNSVSIDANQFISRFSTSGEVERIKTDSVYDGDFYVDHLLSSAELFFLVLALISSSVGYAMNCVKACSKSVFLALVGVVIGAVIRRRHWIRINQESAKEVEVMNLVERTDKLEEDLGNLAMLVLGLSMQLKKLQARFRLTRRALMKGMEKTVTSVVETSFAIRALKVQGDSLQTELVRIQKLLLIMQERQQEQVELILALGKSVKDMEKKTGGENNEPSNQNEVQDI